MHIMCMYIYIYIYIDIYIYIYMYVYIYLYIATAAAPRRLPDRASGSACSLPEIPYKGKSLIRGNPL